MEKNIKDYLHLYLGCECSWEGRDGNTGCITKIDGYILNQFADGYIKNVKLILRPLSDMSDEEKNHLRELHHGNYRYDDGYYDTLVRDAVSTKYLLSKHFDLFGLIEAGLAIDKTKL